MVAEYTDANSDMTIENRTGGYVYTPGGQVGMALARNVGATLNSGTYSYFTQDHLGSTRGLWDGAKLRLAKLNYAPYGEQNGIFGDAPDLQFTGKTWDSESGLYYFPYRYYSPTFKRWLTRDPLGMVDGPNVYAYVRGNPAGNIDADGRSLHVRDSDYCRKLAIKIGKQIFSYIRAVINYIANVYNWPNDHPDKIRHAEIIHGKANGLRRTIPIFVTDCLYFDNDNCGGPPPAVEIDADAVLEGIWITIFLFFLQELLGGGLPPIPVPI